MTIRISTPFIAGLLCIALSACDSAKTTIVEKEPMEKPGDDHDHDHAGEAGAGRLVVISSASPMAQVFDLDDNSLLDSFSLERAPSAIYASAEYRYAVLVNRSEDTVGFLDSGLWREDHVDHFDYFEEAPRLLNFTLSGSRPTHFSAHENQLAVFYDGLAATSTSALTPASVQVLTDSDIGAGLATLPTITYDLNMHGAAEPRGEFVFATVRRADADSSSSNYVLPDQVGIYHWHDGEYELEEVLAVNCPNLHGAAQNEHHLAFGCSDGVLLVDDMGGMFTASKIANPAELTAGLRVGTVYGHEHSDQFIGLASAQGGATVQWVSIDPHAGEMEVIDWQPMPSARPLSHGFSFDGERFVILDNQGYLTLLEPHLHDGETHWEYAARIDITEENPADMPEGQRFSMTLAQNGDYAYVADPIAQHILIVDLLDGDIVGDIELEFAPASLVWLGIPEAHEHD